MVWRGPRKTGDFFFLITFTLINLFLFIEVGLDFSLLIVFSSVEISSSDQTVSEGHFLGSA